MAQSSYSKTLTVEQLLREDMYVIPLYQRNFAWEEKEIEQLLRDIEENNSDQYYIGTLVVSEEEKNGKKVFEVIDGQQRLTAVNIIYSLLAKRIEEKKRYELNLNFESRERSNYAQKQLREKGNLETVDGASLECYRQTILTVERFVKEVFDGGKFKIASFLKEKFLKVCIFRVRLHELTDKNHYFEVMNNRGEQLEAHEIVKAKLMNTLKDDQERYLFAKVWDACSDMNNRIEDNQDLRCLWGEQFTDNPLTYNTFGALSEKLNDGSKGASDEGEKKSFRISDIASYKRSKENPQEDNPKDGLDEKYNSVIDFPNFLLQVLEIGGFKKDVRMDAGKFLLYEFGCVGEDKLPDAKHFIVKLLRLRILFDNYIIKRKRTEQSCRGWRWAIESPRYKNGKKYVVNTFDNSLKDSDEIDDSAEMPIESKPMCMLQAMFFVTFRRDVYMRWLTKAMIAIDKKTDGSSLRDTLLEYSVRFITESRSADGVGRNEYKKGQATHRYVFNFLDYQLWYLYYCQVTGRENSDLEKYSGIIAMMERKDVKLGFQHFIFTRRNSIEHYLAQEKGTFRGIAADVIDDFGNLSLIGGGLNSKLSNRECEEKKEYHDSRNPASLKYELMLSEETWNEETIKAHGKMMADLLVDKSGGYFEEYDI